MGYRQIKEDSKLYGDNHNRGDTQSTTVVHS